MATHSSTLAWKVPRMEEPGGLQFMGSRRVRHDWATSLSLFTFMHWRRKWQPTPVFLPRESQGWGSLVGCRLWGHTESDTTERLHFHFSLSCIGEGNGNPLQCSCLENPRDGGSWWAAVFGHDWSDLAASFKSMSTVIFQMFQLDLEKGRGTRHKIANILWIIKKSKRIPEKHLFMLYWLCQSLWLCGSQYTVENSERDEHTKPPDLPLEKPICRSGSNS